MQSRDVERKNRMNNTIQFHSGTPATEVLRLSKDGIWANPDIPADDAAKLVLEAIDDNIKILVQKAVLAEREACAKVCEEFARKWWKIHCDSNLHYSSTLKAHQDFCALQVAIRARGNI